MRESRPVVYIVRVCNLCKDPNCTSKNH